MHSRARTKSAAMGAGQWGMCVEILNALQKREPFGKGPPKDSKGGWKLVRRILGPRIKEEKGAKEKGAQRSAI